MEKLCYALWRPASMATAAWCDSLLNLAAPLAARGAERIRIAVPDVPLPVQDPYPAMRIDAPEGFVSLWLCTAAARGDIETSLRATAARLAGYSVLESTILPNETPATGAREAGFLQICAFAAPPHCTREQFLHAWLDLHTEVAVQTQATRFYNQNIIVRRLTPQAPAWDAIVEERFPDAALDNPAVYYDAVGAPARLAAHQARMAESCARFIDFSTIKLTNCGEYRFGGWRDAAQPLSPPLARPTSPP